MPGANPPPLRGRATRLRAKRVSRSGRGVCPHHAFGALIRQRVEAGETPDQIRDWGVARYGNGGTYVPPLEPVPPNCDLSSVTVQVR